jgi:hypothetical protein
MAKTIPENEMTAPEGFSAMEAALESHARKQDDTFSPLWHGDVLLAPEQKLLRGQTGFVDWEICKAALQKSFEESQVI